MDLDALIAQAQAEHSQPQDLDTLIANAAEEHRQALRSRDVAFGRGAAQGATFGFGDEAGGLIQALGERYLPESLGGGGEAAQRKPLGQLYASNRDAFRHENDESKAAHPNYYLGGNVAGAIATAPALPAASGAKGAVLLRSLGLGSKLAGVAGRLGAAALNGAGQGATFAAGDSTADLTQGEAGKLAGDVGRGALVGGGLGLGLGGLGEAAGGLKRALGARVAGVTDKAKQMAMKEQDALEKSAEGSLGGAVQKGSRFEEQFQRYLEDPTVSPELRQQLAAWKSSPESRELIESVLGRQLKQAPGQAADIEAKRALLEAMQTSREESIAQGAERILSPKEAGRQVLMRALRYGPVALGSLAGHAIGGPVGGAMGALAGAGTRPMVHALKRMMKHPGVQKAALEALQSAAGAGENVLGAATRTAGPLSGPASGLLPEAAPGFPALAEAPEEEKAQAILAALRTR